MRIWQEVNRNGGETNGMVRPRTWREHWPNRNPNRVLNKNVLRLLIIIMVGVFGA